MKLVTAACALAAGMALAQVQSANTVGYQDFTGTGSFNLTVATFVPVGTDGSAMTLGNIIGNAAFKAGSDYINIFAGGDFLMSATYSDPADAAYWEIDPGWYTIEDYNGDAENNLNNTALPYGAGIAFCPVSSGAALKYVGELKQAENTLPAPNSFNLCGNTSPKDITLGDITGNASFKAGSDYVNLFDGGDFLMSVTYSDPADAAYWEIDPGWYTIEDYNGDAENNLNNTSIPAGAGFAFCPVTTGARLVVANPME